MKFSSEYQLITLHFDCLYPAGPRLSGWLYHALLHKFSFLFFTFFPCSQYPELYYLNVKPCFGTNLVVYIALKQVGISFFVTAFKACDINLWNAAVALQKKTKDSRFHRKILSSQAKPVFSLSCFLIVSYLTLNVNLVW